MKKIVYYTPHVGINKIVTMITEEDLDSLISDGYVPKGADVLVEEYDENDLDQMSRICYVEYMQFDKSSGDPKLKFNAEMFYIYTMNKIKEARNHILSVLDGYQTRALLKNRQDVIGLIETDKQNLRDLPSVLNFPEVNSPMEFYHSGFYKNLVSLEVNYGEKYEPMLKG